MAIDPDLATVVQAPSSITAQDRSFTLTVTSGPDKGTRFVIDGSKPQVHIGQSEACEIRVTDREVSRRHASLQHLGASMRIVDLGSTNGTRVDRVQIVEALLTGGEIVRVGATSLRVDDGEPATVSVAESAGFGRIVGASREMRRLYPLLERLAVATVPVVIEGETGTGKEAVAEALHEQGPRAKGPFVIFDCTAVAPSLLEAELFGHERGAFTGAVGARPGVFEQASGGTLFIDEIGDLDLALQPKLLRALERREVRRIGGRGWIQVDVRVLAATRRDLDREVEEGRFRDDLFHRLAVARVELPPLRQRKGDVPLLARHFWERLGGNPSELPPDLMRRWELSRWPGNVRELRNAIARCLALGDVSTLHEPFIPSEGPDRAPDFVDALLASGLAFPRARDRMLEMFTERYVKFVLAKHDGNIGRAIEASGIGRRYFEKLRSRGAPKK
ncbi:MAG TPA: sigma 54-interacting transcriptional regulator [Polyangiaceae bacterium]|jgi:DNA-binding NtrC family response regulator